MPTCLHSKPFHVHIMSGSEIFCLSECWKLVNDWKVASKSAYNMNASVAHESKLRIYK